MKVDSFPASWLRGLNLKNFAVNNRDHFLPNLWCICIVPLNPSLIDVDDQQVSFSVEDNGKTFSILVIYASTNYIKRRNLWLKLGNI
jgi:hypothetical protein